jgi:Family of unknown function (DUF6134)
VIKVRLWMAAVMASAGLMIAPQAFANAAANEPAAFIWQPADGARLHFDVFRNGEPFGSHVVKFTRVGDAVKADTAIDLKVAIGPLTLYRYTHKSLEEWRAGRLQAVRAETLNEGKTSRLVVERVGDGLKVAGRAFSGLLDGQVFPSSHWNIDQMKQAAMLSTETGAMLDMKVVDEGVDAVKVGARTVQARRFLVKSDVTARFWYDEAGRWVKCAFEAQGQKVEYRLRELPA